MLRFSAFAPVGPYLPVATECMSDAFGGSPIRLGVYRFNEVVSGRGLSAERDDRGAQFVGCCGLQTCA